jgi:gliding motility-associated-like protein
MTFYLKFLLIFIAMSSTVYGQEICNNGIDDDLDGFIDGFDSIDCPCGIEEFNLPNASFEDQSCCPNSFSKMHCVNNWRQASNTTSDYYNLCGFRTITANIPPPPPDGNGYVGFLNGVVQQGNTYPNLKEYIGTCLPDTLQKGITYEFSFWVLHALGSKMTTISLFGSNSCVNLPFGISGGLSYGCPVNDTNWRLIGETTIRTYTNNWTQHSFSFTPTEEISTIVIGPGCKLAVGHNYYYLDKLQITKEHKCSSFIKIPNVFSPNKDGINDVFRPVLMSNIKATKLLIYNRWGQIVFDSNELNWGWNGEINSKESSAGTYFWVINYTDINNDNYTKKGFLKLFR